jgi:hypothetical protein
LADAIAALPGIEGGQSSDVTLDGVTGKHVAFTVPEHIDCAVNTFYLWYDDVAGPRWPTRVPSAFDVWIYDVGASRLLIESELPAGGTPAVREQMDQIVESIEFE